VSPPDINARARSLSPEDKAQRAGSFGLAAADYERFRPGPPAEAVEWFLPERVATVVDVGAGTGALTRRLIDRADEVIAVEPDARMRAVLEAEVPGARAVEGRGESMPLADASVDAVLASSSWHWVDATAGLQEVARVLRPGGLLGAMWTGPDPESEFMVSAWELLGQAGGPGEMAGAASETLRSITAGADSVPNTLVIPNGLPFEAPEQRAFRWSLALNADELVGLLGTLSWVIIMEAEAREALFTTARRLLGDALGVSGDVTVDLVFKCDAYRARLT